VDDEAPGLMLSNKERPYLYSKDLNVKNKEVAKIYSLLISSIERITRKAMSKLRDHLIDHLTFKEGI